jgi:hypothetical protein
MSPLGMQRIRQYVLDCNIRRLTANETAEYLSQNGFPVNANVFLRYRLFKKGLWEIVNDDRTPSGNQLEGIGKLLDCSKQLVGLFDAMPLIAAIRDYGCGYDHKQYKQQQRDCPEDNLNTDSVV